MKKIFFSFFILFNILNAFELNFIKTFVDFDNYYNNMNQNTLCIIKDNNKICEDNNITINNNQIQNIKIYSLLEENQENINKIILSNLKTYNNIFVKKITLNSYLNKKLFLLENINDDNNNTYDNIQGYIELNNNNLLFIKTFQEDKPTSTLKSNFIFYKNDILIKNIYLNLFLLEKEKKDLINTSLIQYIEKQNNIKVIENNFLELYIENKNQRSILNFINYFVNLNINNIINKDSNIEEDILNEFIISKKEK